MDAYFMMNPDQILAPPPCLLPSIEELKSKSLETSTCPKVELGKDKKVKKRKNICQHKGCKKKLNIISYSCQCQKKFCGEHRLPEDHACTFDYKAQGRELIAKKNPQIINSKITQI